MKTIRFGPVAITLAMLLASPQARAGALGTGFTYQAQLKESGVAVNDTADFVFTLYDADAGGAQIGPMLNADAVSLVDGQLTVELDFGVAAFGPDARWLEIAVRSPAGGGGYTTLSPRQPITAAPVALYALSGPGVASPWDPNGSDIYYDTGNVGIGMTTPTRLLDVAGSAGFDGIVNLKDPAGSNDNMQIDLTGGYEIFRDDLGAGADNTRFWLDTPDQGEVVLGPRGGASYLGNMRLRSKTVSFETDVSSATLKIANGNVGVGTSVPQVALHVLGTDVAPGGGGFLQAGNQSWRNIGIDDNEIMARNNGGVAPLYLNADGGDVILSNNSATGYLGVGTATPAARLHVQGPGGAFGGHVAVFENTDSANADGIAIKINNSSTNRDNNFVTFLNGQNNVAGRIEGFDLQNGDWIDPPPIPNLNLDVNLGITLNPAANWFSPGTPPAASVTGGEVPSLSFDWCNVIGINVLCGFVFDPGEFPLVTVTSTPPNITGSPFTFSTPSITFTPPTQQQIDALMC